MREAAKRIDRRYETKGEIQGIPYGLSRVDAATSGMHHGELIVIAGRPSMGKSAWAGNILSDACGKGLSGLLFTLEMSRGDIIDRLVSAQGFKYHHIRNGQLRDVEWANLNAVMAKVNEWKLFIDDTPAISLREIRAKARRQKRDGLDVVVVDYLQLMTVSSKENRTQGIGEVSRGLKQLARELDVPVILLSQLNRAVDKQKAQDWLAVLRPTESDRIANLLKPSNTITPFSDQAVNESRDLSGSSGLLGGVDSIVNMYAGIPIQDGVRAAMHMAGEIRDSKAGQAVEKLMAPGLEAGESVKQGVTSLVLPTAKSPEHLASAELLGAKLGKMHRNQEMAADQLRADALIFDKMGVHNEKTPLAHNAGIQFMSDMSQGRQMAPKLQAVADRIAGGGFKLEQGLRTDQTAKMVQDWYSDHKVRAALRSPVSAVELMAKPIMDWLVPRQKAGVFGHLADRIIEQNPGKALEELTPEFRQAWNRVDARLGQVRYDRLFMNNAAKNAVQGLVRAPGWSGGTIAEIGGAAKDAAKFLKEWIDTGKAPAELPDRVAYTASLIATVTAANGLLTYLFTGDEPTGTDFWAFRTGGTDEYGRPERFLLPTYLKDIHAYMQDPGKTLLAKTHPIISIMGDLLRNKDYYGVTIANEDDNAILKSIERGEYVLKAFVPFWIRGAQKEAERGGGLMETMRNSPQKLLAPQIGIMPATSDYTKSAAEKLLSKYIGEQIPQGGRTKEQADANSAKREVVRALRNGANIDSLPPKLQDHLGKMTDKQINAIQKESELTPIQASFQHLQDPTAEKSIKVWSMADDKERDALRDIYETRINKHILQGNLDDDELAKLEERIKNAEDRK
jgi:replicative DNA helicase